VTIVASQALPDPRTSPLLGEVAAVAVELLRMRERVTSPAA